MLRRWMSTLIDCSRRSDRLGVDMVTVIGDHGSPAARVQAQSRSDRLSILVVDFGTTGAPGRACRGIHRYLCLQPMLPSVLCV